MAHSDPTLKAVVFDIGATLVTGPPVAPNKVIAALIDGASAAEVSSVIMTTELLSAEHACAVLQARFGSLSETAVSGITRLWRSQITAAVGIEGACETAMSIKRRGLKLGLLSDIWNPYYASVQRALPEVVRAADAVVLSCRTGARKPERDNFQAVLDELGLAPGEVVMVGDTYAHDILPAIEMGMPTVWVMARPEREADSIVRILNGENPAPTVTVSHISQVACLKIF